MPTPGGVVSPITTKVMPTSRQGHQDLRLAAIELVVHRGRLLGHNDRVIAQHVLGVLERP